jgi:hypothetical protein
MVTPLRDSIAGRLNSALECGAEIYAVLVDNYTITGSHVLRDEVATC